MNSRADLLSFRPLYQSRVWGGRELERILHRRVGIPGPVGESWEIVDRPEAQSVVAHGPAAGLTLRALLERDPGAVMGPGWQPARRFPILVKWLDCCERLSLQVHPPAAKAAALGGESKTENWYVAAAAPGAELLVGLQPGVDRARFAAAQETGRVEGVVGRAPVQAGCSILIPSGQVHAIGAGNFILEIQENSDTTYRVDDWGRVGLDGRPRQLHLAAALESIAFADPAPVLLPPSSAPRTLAACPEFRLREWHFAAGDRWQFAAGEEPRILSVVSGGCEVLSGAGGGAPGRLRAGDNVLQPFAAQVAARAEVDTVLLVTDQFSGPERPVRG